MTSTLKELEYYIVFWLEGKVFLSGKGKKHLCEFYSAYEKLSGRKRKP